MLPPPAIRHIHRLLHSFPLLLIATAFVATGCLGYWLHILLTYRWMPPFDHPADTALYLFGWAAKTIALVAIPFLALPQLYAVIRRSRVRVLVCASGFAIAHFALVVVADHYRPDLATMLDDSIARYLPTDPVRASTGPYGQHAGWFANAWASGLIRFHDSVVAVVTALFLVVPGYWCPPNPRHRLLFSISSFLCAVGGIVAYCVVFGLIQPDYDIFHGSSFWSPVAEDVFVFFLASDFGTEFGLILYTMWMALIVFSLLMCRTLTTSPPET